MHKLINLQNSVNIELKWFSNNLGSQEVLLKFQKKFYRSFLLCYYKEETIHIVIEKNCLVLEVIEVLISMINKIRPECKIISVSALREHSRNYNNLIERLKLWKKQGVKLFGFIINVRLDRNGVIMAS